MKLNDYQASAMTTALPTAKNMSYMALGLAGESGEVANKAKKIIRDGNIKELNDQIFFELGDVLWYVAGVASVLGVSLEDVAKANLKKLNIRQMENKISGSGDNR